MVTALLVFQQPAKQASAESPTCGAIRSQPVALSRVNIDYHIAFDTNCYSVPYNLVQELVEVRSTPTTVELFHKGQRVASHLRAQGHGHTLTIAERRPRSTGNIWNGLLHV